MLSIKPHRTGRDKRLHSHVESWSKLAREMILWPRNAHIVAGINPSGIWRAARMFSKLKTESAERSSEWTFRQMPGTTNHRRSVARPTSASFYQTLASTSDRLKTHNEAASGSSRSPLNLHCHPQTRLPLLVHENHAQKR